MRKCTFRHVRPMKTQINLRIRTVRLEPSSSALRNFAYMAIQYAPSEDSHQTARMRRLMWNAQADVNLRWVHVSEGTFSDFVVQILIYLYFSMP